MSMKLLATRHKSFFKGMRQGFAIVRISLMPTPILIKVVLIFLVLVS